MRTCLKKNTLKITRSLFSHVPGEKVIFLVLQLLGRITHPATGYLCLYHQAQDRIAEGWELPSIVWTSLFGHCVCCWTPQSPNPFASGSWDRTATPRRGNERISLQDPSYRSALWQMIKQPTRNFQKLTRGCSLEKRQRGMPKSFWI